MAKSAIINPLDDQNRLNALSTPHGLFVVDEILAVTLDAFWATISLGLKDPKGTIAPAFTVKMPLPVALNLADKISEVAKKEKDTIAEAHAEVLKSI